MKRPPRERAAQSLARLNKRQLALLLLAAWILWSLARIAPLFRTRFPLARLALLYPFSMVIVLWLPAHNLVSAWLLSLLLTLSLDQLLPDYA